ncbi:uncharacterized protein LOC141537487 [Cotesia typhae]|uniref:uncharacterized protein LOC141537487 n=1 Tax=Cotesia typhae TaxID=2053667 RepID=UPI003D6939D1
MAPLSRELTGVVLPHDSFGTHFDISGKTIDDDLEQDNFKKAGEILSEMWSTGCIDGHEVVTNYIEPNNDTSDVPDLPTEESYNDHVRESQYLLQVGKCDDRQCCSPLRSSLHLVLHDLFLSPTYPITQINGHPMIPNLENHDGKLFAPFLIRQCLPIQPVQAFMSMPYDLYCPSLRDDIDKRCCSTCGIYFASITKVAEHQRAADHTRTVQRRKLRPSRIVTRRVTEFLCVSHNSLEWLIQSEVEGADNFIEKHLHMLVSIVTLETVHKSPWTKLE